MSKAVGLLEVYGLTAAFVAGDAAVKAANVTLEVFDKNKPANADSLPVPLLVTVKMRGGVSDVQAAMEIAEAAAKRVSGDIVAKWIIPQPEDGTEPMLKLSAFDKT
ncbi:MAG: BMC domain-containing protein [Clostridiales bacterium]|jgi:microcompartment protein CcmL/EutN|nr:BMC domain-containing protein [Clostridiales bacterium]